MQRRSRGAEEQMQGWCRGTEMQRCRGGAEVLKFLSRGDFAGDCVGAEVGAWYKGGAEQLLKCR